MWGSVYKILSDLMDRHRGAVVGTVIGLLVALLIIAFGFWKTVFLGICILIGYFIGKRFDGEDGLGALWRRLFGE
jgi:uncharacterized membrane protein